MLDWALREGDDRPIEMSMGTFIEANAAIFNNEEFKEMINGGTFPEEAVSKLLKAMAEKSVDKNGNSVVIPEGAIQGSKIFLNYTSVTSPDFLRLFGVQGKRIDMDGDGQLDPTPISRFDILTSEGGTPDKDYLQKLNFIAFQVALNREFYERELGMSLNEIATTMQELQPMFASYAQVGFHRDVNLLEGDFFFLLYLLRDAHVRSEQSGHPVAVRDLLYEPRLRAETVMRWTLWDPDKERSRKAQEWVVQGREKQVEQEIRTQEAWVVQRVLDLHAAEEGIRGAQDQLKVWEKSMGEIPKEEWVRIQDVIQHKINVLQLDLGRYKDLRREAQAYLQRLIPTLDLDKTLEVDMEGLSGQEVLKKAGVTNFSDGALDIAQTRVEEARANLPTRFEKYFPTSSISFIVDVARLLGVSAMGAQYHLQAVINQMIVDLPREAMDDARYKDIMVALYHEIEVRDALDLEKADVVESILNASVLRTKRSRSEHRVRPEEQSGTHTRRRTSRSARSARCRRGSSLPAAPRTGRRTSAPSGSQPDMKGTARQPPQ
jgi:hypothetical protein